MKSQAKPATLQEIAAALGRVKSSVARSAAEEGWAFTERTVRGGRERSYALRNLPAPVRAAIVQARVGTPPSVTPEKPRSILAVRPELNADQREVEDARAALCDQVARLARDVGTDRAVCQVVGLAAAGQLPPELQRMAAIANTRRGDGTHRTLSRPTLYRWMAQAKKHDLAPKARLDAGRIPPWGKPLLEQLQQPQKPSLRYVVAKLKEHLPADVVCPSYDAAYRFIKRVGNVEIERGRMLPRELKKLQPFVRRDASNLQPCDVYTADGHTFDAEVAHPLHGRPFRPEITGVLDVATRRLVGWSVGLAESTFTVLDAWRNAVQRGGVNAIFYVDRGAGFRNEAMANEATGFAARLGSELTHALPYNSQARGLIERNHQTLWVRAAKSFATYVGADMDPEAKQNVFKLTRRDIREVGASRALPSWAQFVAHAEAAVAAYNDTPHRGLPKVRDAAGTMRHMTPNEAWQAAIAGGWEPHTLTADEAAGLFRPMTARKVRRGEIELFGNRYFAAALEEFNGDLVHVGYDIHDPARIWVHHVDGRLICIAEFEANKRDYFPQSVVERAREKRAQGRARRLEAKLDEVQAELNPPQLIEHVTDAFVLPPLAIEQEAQAAVVVPLGNARPFFGHPFERLEWLAEHRDQFNDADQAWIDEESEISREFARYAHELFGSDPVFKVAAR